MLYHSCLRHLISIIYCTHTSKATIATGTKPYTVYLTLITLQLTCGNAWFYLTMLSVECGEIVEILSSDWGYIRRRNNRMISWLGSDCTDNNTSEVGRQPVKYWSVHTHIYCTHTHMYCTHTHIYCTHTHIYCTHTHIYCMHTHVCFTHTHICFTHTHKCF